MSNNPPPKKKIMLPWSIHVGAIEKTSKRICIFGAIPMYVPIQRLIF